MSNDINFCSRRSPVICQNGCVASSQPLASLVGIDILKAGGNAADAAVGVAAALNVTEPCSTGIGGDVFCLFYDSKSKTVKGLNGSGRSPSALSIDSLKSQGYTVDKKFPINHGHAVSVPGAAAAWVDTVEQFGSGKLSLTDILKPAIELAEVGFPVQQLTSYQWKKGTPVLSDVRNKYGSDILIQGRAPMTGEIMKMPNLAKTFKELGNHGKKGYYDGRIGNAIASVVQEHGGVMSLEDLTSHTSTNDEPISTSYKGFRVWEMPPNGQGMCALLALNILETYDLQGMGANSAQYLHHVIEAIKLGFADTIWYCADPAKVKIPLADLLSKDYASKRRQLINPERSLQNLEPGNPFKGNDTVYFSTADKEGNACSFINSNFMGFGTGIVPEGCGFTLQNRGYGFSLDKDHPNSLAPNKRPFNTIIPAMVTYHNGNDFAMSYGVMGGYMQPQGHVQVLLNMAEFGMNPQEALDQPRILVGGSYGYNSENVLAEEGISEDVLSELKSYGHNMTGPIKGYERLSFGKGQIIARGTLPKFDPGSNIYWTGCDPRSDGIAIGY